MRLALAVAAVLLVAACMDSDQPAPTASESKARDLFGTDANLASSKPDAILRYAEHARGFAELRLPVGKGPFPLAVIFHGGCWKTGIATQAYMAPLATRWQQLGIATLNVDYREVGDGGGWPESFADWQGAAGLIDQAARDYPLDRARLTLVGHSAGAEPAMWLAMPQAADGPVGARPALHPSGILVFDGAADLTREAADFDKLCDFAAVAPFMGGTASAIAARYRAISPLTHTPIAKSILFVQAVLPAAPADVQAALRSGDAHLEIHENPGVSHFEIITPGSPAYLRHEAEIMGVLRGSPK